MAPPGTDVKMAGVAEGKKLIGTPTGDDVAPMDRVRALFVDTLSKEIYDGWGATLFNDCLTLKSASAKPHGTTTFEFNVLPEHCNRLGNLHGGCTATVFDICTTTALAPIAKPGYWAFAGVSRTLNVTYLRPAPAGEKYLVESEVVHAGKRLCTIKGVMKREKDGAVIAICEHGKASIDPEVSKL